MSFDRRFISLLYIALLIACILAYGLAVARPAWADTSKPAHKAYTPFDEPKPRIPQEMTADKRLDQHVRVFCKSRNLKDLFADLSAKTGVRLTTDRNVSSQRVIIYFHDRPVRDVMTEVGNTLGLHWLVSGKEGAYSYELFEDQVHANRRSQVVKDLEAEKLALLQDFTDVMTGPNSDQAMKDLAATDPEGYKKMTDPMEQNAADILGGLPPGSVPAILSGQPITVRCGDMALPVQKAIADQANRVAEKLSGLSTANGGQEYTPKTPEELANATVTIKSMTPGNTQQPMFMLMVSNPGASTMSVNWPSVTSDDMRKVVNAPVADTVTADAPVSDETKITIEKLRWLPKGKGLLLGDVLEGIALQSGKDVIADYYLQDTHIGGVRGQTLKQVVDTVCSQFNYACRISDPTISFRDKNWYNEKPLAEPPPAAVDHLWSAFQTNGALTTADLLGMASLTDDQMAWPGLKFIPGADSAGRAPAVIRAWALLSADQEKQARDTDGLPGKQLSRDQAGRLAELLAGKGTNANADDIIRNGSITIGQAEPKIISMPSGTGQTTTMMSLDWSSPAVAKLSKGGTPIAMSNIPGGKYEIWVMTISDQTVLGASFAMPAAISEADRKEVAAQRKADAEAEKVEVIK